MLLVWLLTDLRFNALLPDNWGRTAARIAADMCSLHALQYLHGCKQLGFDPAEGGAAPFHVAAHMDCIDAVHSLPAAGRPTAAADSQGSSPLHVAAMEQNANVVHLLVAHGNINGYDSDGALPLMICAGKRLLEVVASLPNSGANTAHRSYSRRTCRHIVLLQLPHDQPHQPPLQQNTAALLLKFESTCIYAKLSLPVPAALTDHFEMLKVRAMARSACSYKILLSVTFE